MRADDEYQKYWKGTGFIGPDKRPNEVRHPIPKTVEISDVDHTEIGASATTRAMQLVSAINALCFACSTAVSPEGIVILDFGGLPVLIRPAVIPPVLMRPYVYVGTNYIPSSPRKIPERPAFLASDGNVFRVVFGGLDYGECFPKNNNFEHLEIAIRAAFFSGPGSVQLADPDFYEKRRTFS